MISVVCPVYNEEDYIENVLSFFVSAAPAGKELLIIDGGSADRTREIVKSWSERHPGIRLLDNPRKYVPFALNLAIPQCSGSVIVRLDAHTEYAPDYFTSILSAFEKSGADIVGGPMRAVGKTPFQKAVAYCTSTPFGVGDSSFHDEHAEGFVDTVYLGAWKASIFKTTGYFDEQMLRNQDDEFHYRAASKGYRIYLDPSIRSTYFPRNEPRRLFSQYFQYGLFKPLVLRKVKSGMRLRHLVPSAFVGYLLGIPPGIVFLGDYYLLPLALYMLLDLFYAISGRESLQGKTWRFLVYPMLHIAYGSGFLLGIGKRSREPVRQG